jgi:hypothetical protein
MLAAQAAVEYVGATASVGAGTNAGLAAAAKALSGVSDKRLGEGALPAASQGRSFLHLPGGNAVRDRRSQEDIRRSLEASAGQDGAKLMLRCSPADARVKIDGKLVGETPLLLILPPGRYTFTFESDRFDTASQNIDLLPKETREFVVRLEWRYPIQFHLGSNRLAKPGPRSAYGQQRH